MNKTVLCLLLAAAALIGPARADEPPIIAKARAYLGTEQALDAVRSIHMQATMETQIVGDPSSKRTARLDIIFQKPWQECLTQVAPDALQRRVLDDYDGWQLQQRLQPGDAPRFDPSRPETLTILGPQAVAMLRADTWENLYFYRGLEDVGGTITDLGRATRDGIACEKVELRHSATIVYYRYFDLATGRLVFTETYAGAKIREQGDNIVDGVRFPVTIVLDEQANGKLQRSRVTLQHITLNEAFPESIFLTPPPPMPVHPLNRRGPIPAPSPAPSASSSAPAAPAPGAAPSSASAPSQP